MSNKVFSCPTLKGTGAPNSLDRLIIPRSLLPGDLIDFLSLARITPAKIDTNGNVISYFDYFQTGTWETAMVIRTTVPEYFIHLLWRDSFIRLEATPDLRFRFLGPERDTWT